MNIPSFRPKLKLIHNALILISVPLIFGFIIACGLNAELQQSFLQRRTIERSAIASITLTQLVNDCLEFKNDQFASETNFQIDKIENDRLKNDVQKIHSDLNKLTDLSANSQHYREMLADALPAAEQAVKAIDQFGERSNQATDKNQKKLEHIQLESSLESLKAIAHKHADALPTNPEAAKLHDRMVQQFLAWLLAANILICPLIVLYFSQNVVRRLLVLVSNAERLAHDKELLEPVGGDDEIAHLDKVFRLMTDTIRTTRAEREEAERLKKEFVAMIGHDLRTPLSSVQGTLTLLADGIYGDISEIGIKKAKAAEKSIERITHLANELLDIEKI
jgi:K+-sensing histidine kinase KdpD